MNFIDTYIFNWLNSYNVSRETLDITINNNQ